MPGRNLDSGAREKVVKSRWEESRRSVRETFAAAAAPKAAEMPGTTSKSMLASRRDWISSAARPKRRGSPPLRRTTILCLATLERRSELMSCWVRRRKLVRLPTSIRSAVGGIRFRISGPIRESWRTTSALWRMRRALMVRSSGSPGPAPIRKTFGVLRDREGAEERLSSGAKAHLSIGFTPGLKPRPPKEKTFLRSLVDDFFCAWRDIRRLLRSCWGRLLVGGSVRTWACWRGDGANAS